MAVTESPGQFWDNHAAWKGQSENAGWFSGRWPWQRKVSDRSDLRRTTFSVSSSSRQRASHQLRSQSLWARHRRASKTCVAATKSKYLGSDDLRATRWQSWWLACLHSFLPDFSARRSSCNCRPPCSPADCSRLLS